MSEPQRTAAHAYLAAIVESSDDAILSKDLTGIVRSCNPATERVFGYTPGELLGKSIRVLVPPERQAEEDDILARIKRGERVNHFETVRRAKDGRLVDVSLTISPVHDAAGHVVGASKIVRDITEQKRARAAQAYLSAIVASSEDAILSKDLTGVIRSANAAAERVFGYSATELVGSSIRLLIPDDRQREEDEILERVRAGERLEHFETVRLAKGGRPVEISLSVSPIHDESGAIVGVAKIARDITEQKRLERELAAQQEWFRVTLGSIGDAVIASDPDGRVTYMNPAAETLTGWPTKEASGRALAEVFHIINEKTRLPVDNPAALVMRSGHIVGLANHTVLIDKGGVERPIADSAAPIRDPQDRMIGVVLVFRDVTEERKAEEAIAEQREWFETTLESIGDAVIATDVEGRVQFMNALAEHLTGWRLSDAAGHKCDDVFRIVNEDTRRTVESPVTRVLAEGTVVGLANHTVLISADGTERPIDDSGAPIRGRDGRIVGVVLVFRDVTDRRNTELERRNAAAERERLLDAERVARSAAERASRVKDEFVAMVSHELRTPLNAMLGWTQLMTRQEADQTVIKRGVDVIARNTRVQAQLISDLLDVSRIVSGKLSLDIHQLNLPGVVADAVDTVQKDADDKGVIIARQLQDTAGPVAGDPARLRQIIWNLLSNAIKFTAAGGTVTVSVRRSGSDAQITVADSGVGIKPDFLPHIFDRFQQADQSITRRFGGLGLGLAIVKHLVELHGGSICAESPGEGKGTIFTILLPSSARTRAEVVDTKPHDAPPSTFLSGIRVFIVEDEPDTREFLERYLTASGAEVQAVGTATDALARLPECEADVLVSDIGLPDIDGYDLMREIRRLEPRKCGAIPAVALTAYARSEDRTRALRAGYQAHLAKPVEPAELIATIASFAELIEAQRRSR
jgi:PAS domain S-box-containing protein